MPASMESPQDDWLIRVESTLDNRYGDFDLHGDPGGEWPVERRSLKVRREPEGTDGEQEGWHLPGTDDSEWPVRLWSESVYWCVCRGETFDASAAAPLVYSTVFGDLAMRSWAGRMGRVPRRFLQLGRLEKGESVLAKTYVIAPAAGRYWIRTESNGDISGRINSRDIVWHGGPEERTAWIELKEGMNELLLRAGAIRGGLVRAGVEVNRTQRPPLPKWLFTRGPNPRSSLTKRIECGSDFRRVRLVFAARGRAALSVNGVKVTEHGDFNPYIRQGQEEVDVTHLWRLGVNEVRLDLPEGKGEVFADGVIELQNGESVSFFTEEDWTDEQGNAPGVHHFAVLQFAETESLWITPRPHPLPQVGWLMPESVPDPPPLAFSADPAGVGRPVWLRFPLPVGATRMRIDCAGSCACGSADPKSRQAAEISIFRRDPPGQQPPYGLCHRARRPRRPCFARRSASGRPRPRERSATCGRHCAYPITAVWWNTKSSWRRQTL
ncbi:hypothetical protein LJK87_20415 [Paenibacillus sp. P25]|nr:hypothetical protein LJK87_20415 [Paenibacillus sp. P25]